MTDAPWGSLEADLSPPFVAGEPVEHIGVSSPYQNNYYDPASRADLGPYRKLDSGPVSLADGRRTGEDFPDTAPFRQV